MSRLEETDRPVPERLYKYVPPCRLDDILRAGLIRFTQPQAFNDPFEVLPELSPLLAPDPILGTLLESCARTLGSKLQRAIGTQLGILSLADNGLNPLMWAHYASSYEGFVIEMDTTHPFFDQRDGDADSFAHLRRVHYSSMRPTLGPGTRAADMYFTKSECWKYEGEWRFLLPLRQHAKKLSMTPPACEVYLFDFPRESITAILIGCNAMPDSISKVETLCRDIPELERATRWRVRPDAARFALGLEALR